MRQLLFPEGLADGFISKVSPMIHAWWSLMSLRTTSSWERALMAPLSWNFNGNTPFGHVGSEFLCYNLKTIITCLYSSIKRSHLIIFYMLLRQLRVFIAFSTVPDLVLNDKLKKSSTLHIIYVYGFYCSFDIISTL